MFAPVSCEPRRLLPSMGIICPASEGHSGCIQPMKLASKPFTSSSEKTRLKVSCEAMPLSKGRHRLSQSTLRRAHFTKLTQSVGPTGHATQGHQQQLIQRVWAVAASRVFQFLKGFQKAEACVLVFSVHQFLSNAIFKRLSESRFWGLASCNRPGCRCRCCGRPVPKTRISSFSALVFAMMLTLSNDLLMRTSHQSIFV